MPALALCVASCAGSFAASGVFALDDRPTAIRVATFNVEDLRTTHLTSDEDERTNAVVETIARIRPTIMLVNEIAYDEPGSPGYREGDPRGRNGYRLAERVGEITGTVYRAFMARSNTGIASGFDLDRDGEAVRDLPAPGDRAAARAYGADAWGYGEFPGQYGMALLVDARLEILEDDVRTFRLLPWSYMPRALMPEAPRDDADGASDADTPSPWYEGQAGEVFRLSSKSHWDVPVRLPDGTIVHVLCSHPTPPAFDGPEGRNKRRNHDEIRFWADYLAGAAYIVDDAGTPGGLAPGAHFVILGDLNADPDEGSSIHNPIGLLLDSPRVRRDPAPTSDIDIEGLDPDDTSRFRLRVDYVLLSEDLRPARSGVWRHAPSGDEFPSDHFPVWVDTLVPARE